MDHRLHLSDWAAVVLVMGLTLGAGIVGMGAYARLRSPSVTAPVISSPGVGQAPPAGDTAAGGAGHAAPTDAFLVLAAARFLPVNTPGAGLVPGADGHERDDPWIPSAADQ
jgi:hypothetical protein